MNVSDEVACEMIKHCTHRTDLIRLCHLLGKNKRVVELGVQAGKFSWQIMANLRPKHFLGFDVWDNELSPYWTQEEHNLAHKKAEMITKNVMENPAHKWLGIKTAKMIKGDHAVLHTDYRDEYFDFVYIDSDHEYDPTVRDIKQWWPKVKKGGILAGHDYKHRRGINELTGKRWKWGVVEAVNEFKQEVSLDFHLTKEYNHTWVFLKPS